MNFVRALYLTHVAQFSCFRLLNEYNNEHAARTTCSSFNCVLSGPDGFKDSPLGFTVRKEKES